MFNPIIVGLDGSAYAEEVLPYARCIAAGSGASLTLMRIVERADEVDEAQEYLKALATRVGQNVKLSVAQGNVAEHMAAEIKANPDSLAALSTHGRTGVTGVLLGSVALTVVRGAGKPVLVYRPRGHLPNGVEINNVVVALDGSSFSETILPSAVHLASDLKAKITLVQALQPAGREARRVQSTSADELASLVDSGAGNPDILESSYLHGHAHDIRTLHNLDVEWEVLHGDPAEAIPSYVSGKRDVILAITAHARPAVERVIFGSVTSACVRNAGVPILVYWQ
ncbi:MAG TPA: universal stress protein [Dehalococcoidia bacterium]|nr:universal stress protein [Dehalococcoidia bacterium]